ncbi:MAG: PTS sugar transporter subunit IIA [Sphingomonadales bacterium]|jgi:PTS system mannose-specific IIA component
MIGIVIVTHGKLAAEFLAAMVHVIGVQDDIKTICIGPTDDMETRREEILQSVLEVNSGMGVIILTDMFGGTPSNLAISVMSQTEAEVIAGVNLPMLIKLAHIRKDNDLEDVVKAAQEAGRKYINIASKVLSGENL